MQKFLTIAAFLAWTTLQMPIVVCDHSCGTSEASPLWLAQEHYVHGPRSDHAHVPCGCGAHDVPGGTDGAPDDDESHQHVVVQPVSGPVGVPAALPTPLVAFAAPSAVAHLCARPDARPRKIALPGEGPPDWAADIVSALSRQLV